MTVDRSFRHLRPTEALLAAGTLFTACAWLAPGFDVAYGGEGMHIALDAIETTVFVIVASLAWARYARTGLVLDLTAAAGFGVFSIANALILALPTLLNHELLQPFPIWMSAGSLLLGALVLLVGSLAGDRTVRSHTEAALAAVAVTGFVGAAVAAALHRLHLPLPIDPAQAPVGQDRRPFSGDTRMLVLQGLTATVFLAAAVMLRRRSSSDQLLLGWLGPALTVGSVGFFNFMLFPSAYSYWVYSGDILQLGVCVLLTAGVASELRAAGRRTVDLAVLQERRRLARDLHDGVAQELAFIATELSGLSADAHPAMRTIRSAAERALFESRRAIEALTLVVDRPLPAAIAAAVADIPTRSNTAVQLALDESIQPADLIREAMLRIVREATVNAIRHGHAKTVSITLDRSDESIRLAIADDGIGFGVTPPRGGFGLTSMTERAAASGGALRVVRSRERGVVIEASWSDGARGVT